MNTALLIIDVQCGILSWPKAHEPRRILDCIGGLLHNARTSSASIIYVQHDGEAGHPLAIGTEGWQIHSQIAPAQDETVIHKRFCDSFFETGLEALLRERDIGHLILTGCMTEYCVDTACRSAISRGFDVTLVADAHTTIDSDTLTGAQIIAHHNRVLDGFAAGAHSLSVKPSAEISF